VQLSAIIFLLFIFCARTSEDSSVNHLRTKFLDESILLISNASPPCLSHGLSLRYQINNVLQRATTCQELISNVTIKMLNIKGAVVHA
jgi:hypothetical protein